MRAFLIAGLMAILPGVGVALAGPGDGTDPSRHPRPPATHIDSPATQYLQPAPAPVAADGTVQALATLRLNAADLSTGTVKAIADNRVETVTAANVADRLAAHAVFVQRTGNAATKASLPESLRAALPPNAGRDALRLSYTLTASRGAAAPPLHLAAFVDQNTGLLFDAQHAVYNGSFSVALSNIDDASDRRTLDTPISVSISAQGATRIMPTPLVIADVGSWHPVTITVPNPGSPFHVAVSADPQDKGNAIDLEVSRPTVQLIPASPHIVGWGIGEVRIAVHVAGLPESDGVGLSLQADHGGLTPSSVVLDAQGNASITLRSDSSSGTNVRVGNPGMTGEPVAIAFDPPWLFLLSAAVGGLVGAFLRGKGRKRWPYALGIGIGAAVLMTIAYAVGMDWVSRTLGNVRLASSGEAVVFVLGALAALLGVTALVPKTERT